MSISISGSNSIAGLSGNDTDFDKVLTQLKQIESTQLNRLEAWKADWQLRYDAFSEIIEQVQAAKSMLSQLSDRNSFVTKLVKSSNDNIVSAVANASAQDVQHTIKVSQVASNAIWANTGHVFSSKTDIINTSGSAQAFRFNYAGKDYSINVPAGTNLDSFVSMVNNSTENPGIKVSLIQMGSGYVFQVAGKDTGVDNNLVIYDANLVGMQAAGSQSMWQTNSAINLSQTQTSPSDYVFDLVLQGGTKKSVTIRGDATADEIVQQLNNAAYVNARWSDDGTQLLMDVQSFSVRESGADAYQQPSLTVNAGSDIDKTPIDSENSTRTIKFTLTLDGTDENGDPITREFFISGSASRKELLAQMARASGAEEANFTLGSDGWSISLAGVTDIKAEEWDAESNPPSSLGEFAHGLQLKPAELDADNDRLRAGQTRNASTTYTSTLTFDKDKLDEKLQPDADKAGALRYTIVMSDGSARYVDFSKEEVEEGTATYEELANRIAQELGLADGDGRAVLGDEGKLVLAGVKSVTLTTGTAQSAGYSQSLEATTTLQKSDLMLGGDALEIPPDLVYTVTTNDGRVGTLTLPSGSTMQKVLWAMKNTGDASIWQWTEADGQTPATAPANIAAFTDADGNEYLDADGKPMKLANIDGPIYLAFNNVQLASGPGVSGQVASSTNWSIQRAANSRYQVDNWPIEMESSSNSVGDVIEGVVFSIQDVGDARISVSTDIPSVEQSIQNFLDAVNSVLLTVNKLMAYDESKEVTSNDPNDIGNDNYSASGLTNQKGSLLTGNYGVQLFKSRFSSLLSSSPPGFSSRSSATDVLSGDLLANLANLGIKTDTDSTSDTYGLLVLAPSSSIASLQALDKENYNNHITNNLEAVVDFFCTSGTGTATSTDIRYGSHVSGITKAGTYDVSYTVDANGRIGDVYVGGVKASRDESQPGNYYSVASGDARGLSILIDDLTPGEHTGMQVRIKQGLVQTVHDFFTEELTFNDVSISANSTESQVADALALMSKNGALMSLRKNYANVMENIQSKIEREQSRIDVWYNRQKTIFANLETLLKQYAEQQTSLEAQLKQLSSGD